MDRRLKIAIFTTIFLLLALLGHFYKEKKVDIAEKTWGYEGRVKDSKGNIGILKVYVENNKISKAEYDEICYPESKTFSGQRKKNNEAYNLKMKEKSGISWDEAVEIILHRYENGGKVDAVAGATGTSEIFIRISKKIDRKMR